MGQIPQPPPRPERTDYNYIPPEPLTLADNVSPWWLVAFLLLFIIAAAACSLPWWWTLCCFGAPMQ